VLSLDEATGHKWTEVTEAESGCTIIMMTVSSFNQSKDKSFLRIHQGDEGSPWNQLAKERKRPLWVFYDEGHNATENQFARLFELRPQGFLMASASPLSPDLWILIPGEDKQAKEETFNGKRTTKVDTAEVVKAGLLKRRIEIHDLSTAEDNVLAAAYKKRQSLESVCKQGVIACYVVDRDSGATGAQHGLRIWEKLVKLGAEPRSIAVHLSGAKKAAELQAVTKPTFSKLIATYDDKVGPEELKKRGFRHLIWNLSLEEGWDEPWAYVGYFHGEQNSETKVTQRIGRLIRNPFKDHEGLPELPGEPALETVYCYLNASEGLLTDVVERLRGEMETSLADVVVIKEVKDDFPTTPVPTRQVLSLPSLFLSVRSEEMEKGLHDELFRTSMAKEDYIAKGKEIKQVIDLQSNKVKSHETVLSSNVPTTVGRIVYDYLEMKDWRFVRARGSVGGWLSESLWSDTSMQKPVAYTSRACEELKRRCDEFIAKLDRYMSLQSESSDENWIVPDFEMVNPDGGDTEKKRSYYKVHKFSNSAHLSYNGLNNDELTVARAIDALGVPWIRNKDRVGYGIPLVHPSGSSAHFYPDFIVWPLPQGERVVFLEFKGGHLLEQMKSEKMVILPSGMTLSVVTEGKSGHVLLRQFNGKIQEDNGSLSDMVKMAIS
jgi:type III restriction enzyme